MLTLILNLFIYIYIIYFICIRYIYIYISKHILSFILSRSHVLFLSHIRTFIRSLLSKSFPSALSFSSPINSILFTPNNNNIIINLTNSVLHFYMQRSYRLPFVSTLLHRFVSPFARLLSNFLSFSFLFFFRKLKV